MIRRALSCRAAAGALAVLAAATPAGAQEWRAAVQVGRVSYEGAPSAVASTSSTLSLGVNRTDLSDWLGISAGIPLADDPLWGVAAARRRFERGVRVGPLLDLSAHAFLQRELRRDDPQAPAAAPLDPLVPPEPPPAPPSRSAQGVGGEALAGAFATLGRVRLETRGGAAAQASERADVAEERLLPVVDGRLLLARLPLTLSAEARGWWADEGRHVYAGATAQLARGPLLVWASAGRWLERGADGIPWAGGATLGVGRRVAFEVSARGNAFDPLYRTQTDFSFAGGASVRLGGDARRLPRGAPVPAAYEEGRALVRVRAADVAARPSIAGDFTGWKPQPMRRDGDHWTFAIPLAPGVYHYAFVAEDGTSFVPEGVPGRRDDGMGGHVAVLVVTP